MIHAPLGARGQLGLRVRRSLPFHTRLLARLRTLLWLSRRARESGVQDGDHLHHFDLDS